MMSSTLTTAAAVVTNGSSPATGDLQHTAGLDTLQQVLADHVLPLICVLGMACNSLNLLILTRPQMKESPYTYLLGLAVADLGVLLLVFTNSVLSKRLGRGIYAWQVFDGFIFLPLGNIFANSSIWITLCLTVERWVSVKFPLKAKELCTKKMARRTLYIIAMVSCVANVPRFFCRHVRLDDDRSQGNTSSPYYILVPSEFEQSAVYTGITWGYIALIHIIPCLTLIVLNTCLLKVVYRANADRLCLHEVTTAAAAVSRRPLQHATVTMAVHVSREQRRLTVTCVSIICLFLVCIIPTALSNPPLAYALFGRGQDRAHFMSNSVYKLLRTVTNTLLVCNLSLNFVLYCLFNHKFFKTLRHLTKSAVYRACRIQLPDAGPSTGAGRDDFRRFSSSSSMAAERHRIIASAAAMNDLSHAGGSVCVPLKPTAAAAAGCAGCAQEETSAAGGGGGGGGGQWGRKAALGGGGHTSSCKPATGSAIDMFCHCGGGQRTARVCCCCSCCCCRCCYQKAPCPCCSRVSEVGRVACVGGKGPECSGVGRAGGGGVFQTSRCARYQGLMLDSGTASSVKVSASLHMVREPVKCGGRGGGYSGSDSFV